MPDQIPFFICLFTAHLLGDILLPPHSLKDRINRPVRWAGNAILHGLLGYGLCMQWHLWLLPAVLVPIHAGAGVIRKKTCSGFILGQVSHILVIILLILFLPFKEFPSSTWLGEYYLNGLVVIDALFLLLFVSGKIIGIVMNDIAMINQLKINGLKNGGKLIGRLERFLILIFVWFEMPSGIGFLIAAKSIFRFSETRDDQRMAEYVLIGTFLSFSVAILVSMLAKWVVSNS